MSLIDSVPKKPQHVNANELRAMVADANWWVDLKIPGHELATFSGREAACFSRTGGGEGVTLNADMARWVVELRAKAEAPPQPEPAGPPAPPPPPPPPETAFVTTPDRMARTSADPAPPQASAAERVVEGDAFRWLLGKPGAPAVAS